LLHVWFEEQHAVPQAVVPLAQAQTLGLTLVSQTFPVGQLVDVQHWPLADVQPLALLVAPAATAQVPF
jgi:hypothetical protein